jgi:hypothetical protein
VLAVAAIQWRRRRRCVECARVVKNRSQFYSLRNQLWFAMSNVNVLPAPSNISYVLNPQVEMTTTTMSFAFSNPTLLLCLLPDVAVRAASLLQGLSQ